MKSKVCQILVRRSYQLIFWGIADLLTIFQDHQKFFITRPRYGAMGWGEGPIAIFCDIQMLQRGVMASKMPQKQPESTLGYSKPFFVRKHISFLLVSFRFDSYRLSCHNYEYLGNTSKYGP